MASYGYGYGSFTSQPQQYSAGSFPSHTAGTYGYASTQPASRVVQGFQTGSAAAAAAAAAGYGTYAQAQAAASIPAAAAAAAAAATSGGYGYFQRASDPSTAYVTTQKTHYATTQAYGYAGAPVKATYSAGTTGYQQQKQTYIAATPVTGYAATTQRSSNSTLSYNSAASYPKQKVAASVKTGHQNAYEKVVYNAATSFLSQQAAANKPWNKSDKPTFKLQNQKSSKNSGPPKPQQLHYCEVCKISCAGPQTYKEHLEGQKHKKRAASQTSDTKNLPKGTYKCELCDVICTGRDAFSAHIKGANHTKTIKLHQKLGKPIPEIKIPEEVPPPPTTKSNVVKTTAPKINFVGGNKLTSSGEEVKVDSKDGETNQNGDSQNEIPTEGEAIGEEYVEEIKSDVGKVIGFKCTICDCRFNDLVAKAAHVKGRRHRVSYKRVIDTAYHQMIRYAELRNIQIGRKRKITSNLENSII